MLILNSKVQSHLAFSNLMTSNIKYKMEQLSSSGKTLIFHNYIYTFARVIHTDLFDITSIQLHSMVMFWIFSLLPAMCGIEISQWYKYGERCLI